MSKNYEKALDDFLDDDTSEKLQELFYQTVKAAFKAGYKAKKTSLNFYITEMEKKDKN